MLAGVAVVEIGVREAYFRIEYEENEEAEAIAVATELGMEDVLSPVLEIVVVVAVVTDDPDTPDTR